MDNKDLATGTREAVPDDNGHTGLCGSSEISEERSDGVSRREMLKIAAGAVVAAPLVGAGLKAKAAPPESALGSNALLFFTPEEFAMVDELTELIIPTDEH